jgi:putative Holliday junction resolvase
MRQGKRLALDIGKVRIGVAVCDSECILSSPLAAIKRVPDLSRTVSEIKALVEQLQVLEVYVGEPVSLGGQATQSTEDARVVAEELANAISAPVRMVDERFTTVSAAAKLRSAGLSSRQAKSHIDSASAVEILELALRLERSSGAEPGLRIGTTDGP